MLDRLFDFVSDFLGLFQFWVVIDEYERGVLLTFGKRRTWRKSVLGPGLHFIIPLNIDSVYKDNVVPSLMNLGQQSLTTADGKAVVVTAVVMWSIIDIEKVLIEVEDADSALEEAASGIIGQSIEQMCWDDLHGTDFVDDLADEIAEQSKLWGIKIHSVKLRDLSLAPSLRIWNE